MGSPRAKGAGDLIVQRLHEVGQHGAVMGLHEAFNRHSRDQLHVPQARGLRRIDVDSHRIEALPGPLILRDIGRDAADHAVDLWSRPLVQS